MNKDAIRQYLGALMNILSENANAAEIQESDEGPALFCSMNSPFDGEDELVYQIFLQPVENGAAAEIMIFMFNNISQDKQRDISILINRINQYVTLGSFRFFEDDGAVMFCQGMMFDDDMETVRVTELIFRTIHAMEKNVLALGGYLERAVKGEDTEVLIDELKRRNNDGQRI